MKKRKLVEVFKKIKVWNTCMDIISMKTICMEFMYGNYMYGILVWKSLFVQDV